MLILAEAPKSRQTHVHSLAPASLDYQLLWPFYKLCSSCSKRPSGMLMCFGSDATQCRFYNLAVSCKERNSSSLNYHNPLLSKNLWFFNNSGSILHQRKVITKDKLFNELPRPTVLFCIPLFSDLVFDSVLFWRAKNGPRVFWGMM